MPLLEDFAALFFSELLLVLDLDQQLCDLQLVPRPELFKLELRGGIQATLPDPLRLFHHDIILLLHVSLSAGIYFTAREARDHMSHSTVPC